MRKILATKSRSVEALTMKNHISQKSCKHPFLASLEKGNEKWDGITFECPDCKKQFIYSADKNTEKLQAK